MDIWYLETSALNEFMTGRTVQDALATKQFQLDKGRDWRLSPVTIWEILMTSNEQRREDIIYFCQHLFSRELLPSPSELIVPWIEEGMKKTEGPRNLTSNTAVAETWRDLVDDRRKTFFLDYREFKAKMKRCQSNTKSIYQVIKNGDIIIDSNSNFSGLDYSLCNLVNELPFVKEGEILPDEEYLAYKVSLFYILFFFCAGADFENYAVDEFWKKRGIKSVQDRIFYVLSELPKLVHRGPFILMSYMTIAQSSKKHSRGVWYDSLHSIYITYVEKMFTNDGHFKGLRDIIPEPILRAKIHHLDELKINTHPINMFGLDVISQEDAV